MTSVEFGKRLLKKRTYFFARYQMRKRRIKEKWDKFFFKYFYASKTGKAHIILADYAGYPLYREKPMFKCNIQCGIGNLLDHMTRFKSGIPYDVTLIINMDEDYKSDKYIDLQKKYSFIKKIIRSDNIGFDFGAYNKGYQYLQSIDYEGDVVFMNSSVRGPYADYWLSKYSYLFHRRSKIGLCGISLNSHTTHLEPHEFKPHVQSFFMYTNMRLLSEVFGNSLAWENMARDDKLDIISKGEIGFSTRILDSGYGISSSLFDNIVYYKNKKWKLPFGDTRFHEIYGQFANKI